MSRGATFRPLRLPSGRWQIRWYEQDGTRPGETFATEAAARAFLRRKRVELDDVRSGLRAPPAELVTFGSFVRERWWPTYPGSVGNRPTTIREKEIHLRVHLYPTLENVPLDECGGETAAALFAKLRQGDKDAGRKPLAAKSIKNVRTTLAKILASAEEWGVLSSKPRLPKVKVPEPPWDFFAPAECDRLLEATRTPEERALLLFAIHTGARAGEQLAIAWGDLDWHSRHVVIRRALVRDELGPTKSGKERHVPMSATLAAALKALRGLQHLQGGMIFARPDGKPYSLDQLHERLWGACRRAGLREIRWHDLRHTFGSWLVSSGVDLLKVKTWMGHSSITTTMRYAHLAPGAGEAIGVLDTNRPPSDHAAPRSGIPK